MGQHNNQKGTIGAKERKKRDHHLIKRQHALLPIFENEEDADSKIDVGVDEDKELRRGG
jgi:hypothetical protein